MSTNTKIILFLFCLFANRVLAQPAEEAFQKVSSTLESLTRIRYDSYREINNKQDNYFAKNSGTSYFEYDPTKEGGISRFQMQSDKTSQLYNGTEYYILFDDKTYEGGKRKTSSFSSLSLIYNSITTLRVALPLITADAAIPKSVKDTSVDGRAFRLLKFELYKKAIEFPGGFVSFDADVTRYYELLVDPASNLPYMIIDRNSIMKDQYHTKTIFTNIDTKPASALSRSWFISDYDGYTIRKEEKQLPLITTGSKIPEWKLAMLNEKKPDTLLSASLKGKKTIMEFWIKNCGYCMLAFPEMKELHKKFGNTANIVSVNAYEERDDVNFFYNREKPPYSMLYGGEKLATKMGIYSYPSVVITDENGVVIYASRGFNRKEIEKVLMK
ncbi:TlpA family protein disulfide reductase [Terrimonas sp. NA20]|uniref:TlpA family protein disulfide reductase n=1 Tax=Terrimonas ginsenosidimutans TaxID=2908004 RepID=A0ABS9KUK4_9BACT|nr:TlpA disulfide reductase family protein [Terrimonas ginsenosidimutans]MCG2615939.1 TlpA family protein disulfide reductase [Terrimonas ginsenosidimutans]